jgi:hypothetical protein
MEITDATQGIWFMSTPGGDWMMTIDRTPAGAAKIIYRFRYYEDDKAFDSKDRKNWYQATHPDFDRAMEGCRVIAATIRKLPGAGKQVELLRGNLSTRDFMDLLIHQEFAHTKKVSKEEYEGMRRKGKI